MVVPLLLDDGDDERPPVSWWVARALHARLHSSLSRSETVNRSGRTFSNRFLISTNRSMVWNKQSPCGCVATKLWQSRRQKTRLCPIEILFRLFLTCHFLKKGRKQRTNRKDVENKFIVEWMDSGRKSKWTTSLSQTGTRQSSTMDRISVVCALVAALLFANTWQGEFVYDDRWVSHHCRSSSIPRRSFSFARQSMFDDKIPCFKIKVG